MNIQYIYWIFIHSFPQYNFIEQLYARRDVWHGLVGEIDVNDSYIPTQLWVMKKNEHNGTGG